MPPLADLSFAGLDDSVYRPTANKTSASVSQVETSITPPSNTSVEMPRVEYVRPIKPSFKKIEFTKARNEPVKSDKQVVKPRMVTQSPKVDRKDWNGKMTQKLELENAKRIYFVKGLTRFGRIPVSTAKHGCSRHMTGNKALLTDYQDVDGGFVAFGGSTRGGKITVLLRVPRQNNMYSFDLKNVVPSGDLTCLFAKATIDESKLWHRRLGHVNFKTINKLVKGNLVRGLPSKTFENDHTCVACQNGKQHKASCKTKHVSSISQPLQMLHMDLFGPTSVRSINHKTYCLVVTGDFSREYSVARTPQQNGVAERNNRTLIEEARTMLADSLLPTVFWAEAVNTTCYVLNRVLVTKPHNKTPYELIIGREPSISFMRPFGCPVTILNTLEPLGQGPNWIFDIDSLTNSMNYHPVTAGNQTNKNTGPQETNGNTGLKKNVDAGQTEEENVSTQQYIVFPLWSSISSSYKSSDDKAKDYTVDDDACRKTVQEPASEYDQALKNVLDKMMDQEKEATEQSD
ncbi:putative ribonuclease H-like domain-containing protein, partial [Tanacetum coccineum]